MATDIVFTTKSWKAFRLDTSVKDSAITFLRFLRSVTRLTPVRKSKQVLYTKAAGAIMTCGYTTTGLLIRWTVKKNR